MHEWRVEITPAPARVNLNHLAVFNRFNLNHGFRSVRVVRLTLGSDVPTLQLCMCSSSDTAEADLRHRIPELESIFSGSRIVIISQRRSWISLVLHRENFIFCCVCITYLLCLVIKHFLWRP